MVFINSKQLELSPEEEFSRVLHLHFVYDATQLLPLISGKTLKIFRYSFSAFSGDPFFS